MYKNKEIITCGFCTRTVLCYMEQAEIYNCLFKITDERSCVGKMSEITQNELERFGKHLNEWERSAATIGRYLRDVATFRDWLSGGELDKSLVLKYKTYLSKRYAPSSVNSMLSSLNSFFAFCERGELKVRMLRVQRRIFASGERELTKAEYGRLLNAAERRGDERLYLLMQTVCSTGIRVSELRYITVEAVRSGCADIDCKGKRRQVFLPDRLCVLLRRYIKKRKIKGGSVFVSKNGNPLDRSNIWSDMKRLCRAAGVGDKKVFPHNLRHLFARTYYTLCRDIVRLADILGHSSVNTTRIYTMESGEVHKRQIQGLGLLRC